MIRIRTVIVLVGLVVLLCGLTGLVVYWIVKTKDKSDVVQTPAPTRRVVERGTTPETGDWHPVAKHADFTTYWSPSSDRTDNMIHVWMRDVVPPKGDELIEMVYLVEVDCLNGRSRIVHMIHYYPNSPPKIETEARAWEYGSKYYSYDIACRSSIPIER